MTWNPTTNPREFLAEVFPESKSFIYPIPLGSSMVVSRNDDDRRIIVKGFCLDNNGYPVGSTEDSSIIVDPDESSDAHLDRAIWVLQDYEKKLNEAFDKHPFAQEENRRLLIGYTPLDTCIFPMIYMFLVPGLPTREVGAGRYVVEPITTV